MVPLTFGHDTAMGKINNKPSLIDLINQLVTAGGSSGVQEKDITLLKKGAAILEKKFAELTIEKTILINRMKDLEKKLQNQSIFKSNNQGIQEVNQYFGNEPPNYFPLNERELKILINVSLKKEISLGEISQSLNILEQIVGFYLKELETQDMVICLPAASGADLWSLSPKGRKYLLDNGIII
ncbi:MAG: hypothetical protein ABFD50_17385 [Smithella sp.]